MAAPRKTAAAKPKAPALPDPHADGACNGVRPEAFEAVRPDGETVTVSRCLGCGEQTVK